MQKGWKYFDVMHKDRRVARIYEDGRCTINYPSFMPYNLYLESSDAFDSRVNNLNNFYYWCASRVLTLDRKYAKEILCTIGASQAVTDKDRAMIAVSYHGLTLTDVFWIRAAGEKIEFSELNLYNHSLSDAFADVSLRGKDITIQNSELIMTKDVAGDVGTPGVAPKAWIRQNGDFYLMKDGDERDVEAELLASKIVGCFKIDYVPYEEDYFDDVKVSKCKIITSEDRSIVPYEFIDIYCVNREINKLEFVLKKDSYAYYMMNIVDYLIGNTDRHWGNWGFFVDNNTNKLQGLYYLMDFNKSFLSYDNIDGALCQTTDRKITQREAAIEAVKKIGLNQISEVQEEWFSDKKTKDMFMQRLDVLRNAVTE
ncbi:MAG: hypothetical protein IJ349_07020 [Clostridia bacterium]|nr:hypothetical protein [Clostridia bacterium]